MKKNDKSMQKILKSTSWKKIGEIKTMREPIISEYKI